MSDGVDIVVTLHALATYAESANHWTDDKRMMDASGVADTICEAIDRIEALEERAETLEELVMDVVADLREGVSASKIDYRIGKVMQKLEWDE